MKRIGEIGWIEKEAPKCGPLDAIVAPLAVAPCSSDVQPSGKERSENAMT